LSKKKIPSTKGQVLRNETDRRSVKQKEENMVTTPYCFGIADRTRTEMKGDMGIRQKIKRRKLKPGDGVKKLGEMKNESKRTMVIAG